MAGLQERDERNPLHRQAVGFGRYVGQCPVCLEWYRARRSDKATCSAKCRVKFNRIQAGRASNREEASRRAFETKSMQTHTLTCVQCGREFCRDGNSAPNAMYCSNACSQRAYRQRQT